MTLLRSLHAEALKMKRTIALKMVVVSPAIVVLLVLFLASQAPFTALGRHGIRNQWNELAHLNLRFWALLMMPLYVTLESALVAGLDHSGNQWKSLLARPVPRWTVYAAKLIVVLAMTCAATSVLVAGILLSGVILPHVQAEAVMPAPIPWSDIFRDGAEVCGLMFLALSMQHWVSLRWRSFSIAVGTGIVATFLGFFGTVARRIDSWPQYFPWALPMLTEERASHNIEAVLMVSVAAGLAVSVAGCWDFCSREVA
jgi:hypothetical protein